MADIDNVFMVSAQDLFSPVWGPISRLHVLHHVQLFATLCTVAHQDALSAGLFRQEYWSGLPFPLLGALPNPEIEPASRDLPIPGIEPMSLVGSCTVGRFHTC